MYGNSNVISNVDRNVLNTNKDMIRKIDEASVILKVGRASESEIPWVRGRSASNAERNLEPNKIDQTYHISSSYFINGAGLLFPLLSQKITAMLRHGSTNVLLNKAVIKPIPKKSLRSSADSSNYCAILSNSIITKILDHVIISTIKEQN